MNTKIFEAIQSLLDLLIRNFGPSGTITLVVMLLLLMGGYRVYRDWRTDRAIQRALDEKERSIQRLANLERTWRRLFLTKGVQMSPHEADKLLQLEGDYGDAEDARQAVEGPKKRKKPSR